MDSNSVPSTLSSNYFGTNTICWYRFYPSSSSFKFINIKIGDLTNANAEVYLESSSSNYEYKGSLLSGNSLKITIGSYNPVWVLVTPLSSSAYVSVTGTATISSSDSSVDIYLVVVLSATFGWIAFTLFIIFMIIWVLSLKENHSKKQMENSANVVQDSESGATPIPAQIWTSAPQPFNKENLNVY